MPGPVRDPRAASSPAFEATLLALADACGITRLADITGLDRIGLPVWQAVRPAGRALSVHQGKGASALSARIGALAEAIESHCAEQVLADGPLCAIEALPPEQCASIADHGRDDAVVINDGEPIAWCAARELRSGGEFFLPHDVVSLDFARAGEGRLERSSAGLGLGADEDGAIEVALLECVERDAVGAWRRADLMTRSRSALDPASISCAWLGWWRERLNGLGIALRMFAPDSVEETPVIVCMIGGAERFGGGYRTFSGSAAHGEPEIALFRALAEALQSRLTFIAATRDDLLPSHYRAGARGFPETLLPHPPGVARRDWESIAPRRTGWPALAERLAAVGYPQVATKRLSDWDDVVVTKVAVPGLGSLLRRRRSAQ